MDDIELLQVAPRDGTLEDGSPIPDYPALSTEFFGLASNRIGTLLSVWEFLMVMRWVD